MIWNDNTMIYYGTNNAWYDESWYIMILPWSTMVQTMLGMINHDMPGYYKYIRYYTMVYYGTNHAWYDKSWYTMVLPWYTMVYHGTNNAWYDKSWYTMIYYGIPWYKQCMVW